VGGVGRGAIGFTTRSDIGPARAAVPEVSFGQAPAGKEVEERRSRGRGCRMVVFLSWSMIKSSDCYPWPCFPNSIRSTSTTSF